MVSVVDLPRKNAFATPSMGFINNNDYITTKLPCQVFYCILLRPTSGWKTTQLQARQGKRGFSALHQTPKTAKMRAGQGALSTLKTTQLQARQGKRGFSALHQTPKTAKMRAGQGALSTLKTTQLQARQGKRGFSEGSVHRRT